MDINGVGGRPTEYGETPTPRAIPRGPEAETGCAKLNSSELVSFLDRNGQENLVCLSPRLKALIAQVGGCQTEHVEAVIRRVLYEVLSVTQKY
jgi:hypothetical protein